VEVIGTFIIVLLFIVSYYYFLNKNNNVMQNKIQSSEKFFNQLEQQTKQITNFKVTLAGGDSNSEAPVKEAIERVKMRSDVRIKNYE